MGLEFLKTRVIIFGVSGFIVFFLQKIKVPSNVDFLIAGAALGPHGFAMIREIREVELLAEIGVILLLFTIGLEISLRNLKRIHSAVIRGGFSQVILPLIFYGDGTSLEVLHKLGIHTARLMVIVISDPASTRRIVQIARRSNPKLHIIVRTRYLSEIDDLIQLGANEVIPEEFETSIEIFARVLHQFQIPRNLIYELIEKIRKGSYEVLRKVDLSMKTLPEKCDIIPEIEIETFFSSRSLLSHWSIH